MVFARVCMSTRIPETSEVHLTFQFKVRASAALPRPDMPFISDGAPAPRPTGQGETSKWDVWRTVAVATRQPRDDRWQWHGIIADDKWRHSCMDVQKMVDDAVDAGDGHFRKGGDHKIKNLHFNPRDDTIGTSSLADNPFWIDEFSISADERIVQKTAYPVTGPMEVVEVTRTALSGGVEWEVTMTTLTADCAMPRVDFTLETSGMQNYASHDIIQVQEHSPPLEGNLMLSWQGEQVQVSPYASARDFQEALKTLPSLGDTKVKRTGTCQTGRYLALSDAFNLKQAFTRCSVSDLRIYPQGTGG